MSVTETLLDVPHVADTFETIVGERQRAYLRRLVRTSFPDRRPVQHDYACGNGRAVRLLHGMVREAHGYGSAPLDDVRAGGLRATWHEIPAGGPVPEPAPAEGPAVVTMLGLLPGAPEEERDLALEFAVRALPTHICGLLIVGNDRVAELPHDQVAALLARYDFTIVERHGCTMFPPGAYRAAPLRRLVRRLDELLCRFDGLSRYAADVLYVARRNPVAARPHRPSRG
jgi:hypothetical protein